MEGLNTWARFVCAKNCIDRWTCWNGALFNVLLRRRIFNKISQSPFQFDEGPYGIHDLPIGICWKYHFSTDKMSLRFDRNNRFHYSIEMNFIFVKCVEMIPAKEKNNANAFSRKTKRISFVDEIQSQWHLRKFCWRCACYLFLIYVVIDRVFWTWFFFWSPIKHFFCKWILQFVCNVDSISIG